MKKIIVIVGPTGVGKTKLSILLAKKYNAEVINADSMQIYKGLDIGTAKVTMSEREGIIHHLIDIKDVNEDYSIFNYQRDCRKKIKEVLEKEKNVIIVGGTGLYIKSALYDYKIKDKINDNSFNEMSTGELYNYLISIDKKCIDKIDCKNRRRIINAINYYLDNQQSITDNKTDRLLYDACFIGLTTSRDKLYDVINNRVDEMIKNGLIDEVKNFYDRGIYAKPLINGIGYKELYKYFDGDNSLNESIEKIKKNSRNYAKRQYTFFNNQLPVKWFDVNYKNFDKTFINVVNYLDNINI